MPIVITDSEWTESDLVCPFCGYNLYSDGTYTDCVTDRCKYHELHLMGLSYYDIVFCSRAPYGLLDIVAGMIQQKITERTLKLLESTESEEI